MPGEAFFLASDARLLRLPYPTKCAPAGWRINPGNADLIPLSFGYERPEFDRIWGIEYDVHYEGDWSVFFDHFEASDAALLTTTLYRESPWRIPRPPSRSPSFQHYDEKRWIRAFLPIFRLDRRGWEAIDAAYRAGCGGHNELTWPTILDHAGLPLEDIGGDGGWVRPGNRNRFYFNTPRTFSMSPGTFVFRPPLQRAMLHRENTLWHPVKPSNVRNWYPTVFGGGKLKNLVEAVKPYLHQFMIWWWFLTEWRPLH